MIVTVQQKQRHKHNCSLWHIHAAKFMPSRSLPSCHESGGIRPHRFIGIIARVVSALEGFLQRGREQD